ncbi:hypothetical protein, partial [Enterobacter hormaechei]
LGIVREEAGQIDGAIAAYRAGAAADASHAAVRFSLGNALFARGDLAAAAAWRETVAIDPDFADAHMALYVVLQILRERQAAVDHLRQAVRVRRVF